MARRAEPCPARRRAGRSARQRNEPQVGDFRRRTEAFRRPPVARAAARVDPQAAQAVQPGGERLLQPHQEGPRQELSAVRKWISDGVYQRFNTQFIMMKQIEQVNEISDINIQQVFMDDVESDGNYDIIHVGIRYSMYDAFTSNKFKQLNDGGPLQALEFWSFIKKSGVKEKDL